MTKAEKNLKRAVEFSKTNTIGECTIRLKDIETVLNMLEEARKYLNNIRTKNLDDYKASTLFACIKRELDKILGDSNE